MKLRFLLLASTLALAACGSSPHHRAKDDVMDSKSEYKDCVSDHSDEVEKCDGARINYETDMKTLDALRAK